jgi:hypothetical protein
MALWGTVLGAIFGGIPTNKIGRKEYYYGLEHFLVPAIGSAFTNDPIVFAVFIGGIGVGASTIAPTYLRDCSSEG